MGFMETQDVAKRRRLDPPTDVDAFSGSNRTNSRPQLHPTPSTPSVSNAPPTAPGLRAGLHPQLHPNLQAASSLGSGSSSREELPSGPRYQTQCVLGRGSFGTVCKAIEVRSRKTVAIKTVASSGAGREMEVLRRLSGNPNVVSLLGAFEGTDPEARTLNFVLEYIEGQIYNAVREPKFVDTLGRIIKHHRQQGTEMDFNFVRIYMYQLLRGLGSLYREGIVHRDIKPANLLVDPQSYCLKVCDFGTAKWVNTNEVSQAYVCSRFYRAPELILSTRDHNTSVDMWAAGCVLGEMLLHQPLFAGKDGIDQLFKIMEILGTPSNQQLSQMNPFYDSAAVFTYVPPLKWSKVLRARWSGQAESLLTMMLQYDPKSRPHPMEAMATDFFAELRKSPPKVRIASEFFNFTDQEMSSCKPELLRKLMPEKRPL